MVDRIDYRPSRIVWQNHKRTRHIAFSETRPDWNLPVARLLSDEVTYDEAFTIRRQTVEKITAPPAK